MAEPRNIALDAANAAQANASNPAKNRWVSANAGSGKTKVLVDRVSRLLLSGVDPDKILCLTYTKAAAAEMQSRLYATLGRWSVTSDAELKTQLLSLMGDQAPLDLPKARGLFARALETPEGLKVQTIHAFCAEILRRFPVEAGILPGTQQIDEAQQAQLQSQIRERLLQEAWAHPEGALAADLAALSAHMADVTLDELLVWIGHTAQELNTVPVDDSVKALADRLGIAADADADEMARQAWEATPVEQIRALLGDLRACTTKREPRLAEALEEILSRSPNDALRAWEAYAAELLKADGAPYAKGLVGKGASDRLKAFFGDADNPEPGEITRIVGVEQARKAARLLRETRHILGLARAYADIYTSEKQRRRVLDFNDQIHLVNGLLNYRAAREWVRYKLDGGIDHILVDEAQDTSALQWAIIAALREDFDPTDERGETANSFFAVGDEKQSIFGFQGASPGEFIARINAERSDAVRMGMSFRSAPQVLTVVDAVFDTHSAGERMFAMGLKGDVGDSRHTAHRDDVGCVELWPPVPFPEEDEEEQAWRPVPVDSVTTAHPKEQLAMAIAGQISAWIRTGEPIFDRDTRATRPMRAGDIFILVRSRDAFFEAVIRHLKQEGVPVAGADRLILSQSTVVQDLLSLARWALFPADDLSLAEVLRSPLVGWSDERLQRYAGGRWEPHPDRPGRYQLRESLWSALQSASDTEDQAVLHILEHMLGQVHALPPYEFFADCLDQLLGGVSLRRRIEQRLGAESRDPLNEFLGQVLAYQRRDLGSLQHFVADWQSHDLDIKREQEGQTEEVRIMTVHGAKGLEAPVVILPQTTAAPRVGKAGQMMRVDDLWVRRPSSADMPEALRSFADEMDERERQESLRLLYVAMTRAETRLVVCGHAYRKGAKALVEEMSWYSEVEAGLAHLETEPVQTPTGQGVRFGKPGAEAQETAAPRQSQSAELPDWIGERVRPETASLRRVTPSHLLDRETANRVRSPLSRALQTAHAGRFLRGNVIHKLLEVLPDVALHRRHALAGQILVKHGITGEDQASILAEVERVMADFPDIFAPGSRAEVSLAGQVESLPGLSLSAQIDRISVSPERVWIVDYKSNRPPPATQAEVSGLYMAQMAAYRELAREIFDRPVTCALLWTDRAHLMELEEARLSRALEAVRARFGDGLTIS